MAERTEEQRLAYNAYHREYRRKNHWKVAMIHHKSYMAHHEARLQYQAEYRERNKTNKNSNNS